MYPPDSAMALLVSIRTGNGCGVHDGHLAHPDPIHAGRVLLHDSDDLDELERRGWIAIDASGATVTERGAYWLRKWLATKPEVRRVAGRAVLRTL
jgi:hypothetical protein